MEKLRSLYPQLRHRSLIFNPEFECPSCGADGDHRNEKCENCGRQLM